MRIADVVAAVDSIAPFILAQEWDNVGLLVGRAEDDVRKVLVALDVTDATIEEAVSEDAQVILSHHPLIFRPLKAVTDATVAGRRVARLLSERIAHIAAHTNLDVAPGGVADALAAAVGLAATRSLDPPSDTEAKVVVFTPEADVAVVQRAAFDAGAGVIGAYTECSFRTPGTGTFFGGEGTQPTVGARGSRQEVAERRLEFVTPRDRLASVLAAVRSAHSYEEPAVDVYPLLGTGAPGMIRLGDLESPVTARALADRIRKNLECPGLLTAGDLEASVSRVVTACGSGGDSVRAAVEARADCLVTGEINHHQALDAASAGLVVLAAGHFATERVVLPGLAERLRNLLTEVEVVVSRRERPPLDWYPG